MNRFSIIIIVLFIICSISVIPTLNDNAIVNVRAVNLIYTINKNVTTWYTKLPQSPATQAQATYFHGLSQLWHNDNIGALITFHSLPKDWRHPLILWHIVQTYAAIGETDTVATYLNQMSVKPDIMMTFVRANQSSPDLVNAVSQWADKQGLESFPARRAQGIWLMQRGEHERALSLLEAIITEDPTDHYILSLVARLYYLQGNYQEAVEISQCALELVPTALIYQLRLAQAYQARKESGDLERAQILLERLVLEDTDIKAEILSTLGWNYYLSNNSADAIFAFEQSLELEPDNSYYQLRLAQALVQRSKKNDQERAIALLQKVTTQSPNLTQAKEMLQHLTQQ